jgi:hypothetical protein
MLDRIFKSEDGPGPVEYAVMLAILIALGLGFVGVSPMGGVSAGGVSAGGVSAGGASRSVTAQDSVQTPAVKVGQVQELSKTVQ